MSIGSPWLDAVKNASCPDYIRSRATLVATPLQDLSALSDDEANAALNSAFDQHYFVSHQAIELLANIIGRVTTGIQMRYPSRKCFITNLYERKLPVAVEPICLTGLAGVGKSQLLNACARILPERSEIAVDDCHTKFPFQPIWSLELTSTSSIRPMLRRLAETAGAPDSVGKGAEAMHAALQTIAYRNGVGLLAADEFQFVNASSSANTTVTKMLLSLRALGVPLVFAANYSLIHRLSRRNQEDTQRLLGNVFHLDRADADSPDWIDLVGSYMRISTAFFGLSSSDYALPLWKLSAGLPRVLRRLLISAYSIARLAGRQKVHFADIERAYSAANFAAMRRDIIQLANQTISGRALEGRHDLNPPFDWGSPTLKSAATMLREDQAQKNAAAMQLDALNSQEKATFQIKPKTSRQNVKRPRGNDTDKSEALLKTLAQFKERNSCR